MRYFPLVSKPRTRRDAIVWKRSSLLPSFEKGMLPEDKDNLVRARVELLINIWDSGRSLQKPFMLHLYYNVAYCAA